MKMSLTGTISSGKTTLVKELSVLPQFRDYHIATERSVYLRDQGISLNDDSTLKGQFVFAAERSIELMKPNLLSDRSIWDICAFTLSSKSIPDHQKRQFVELVMELKNEYDIIFYVNPDGVEIVDNGIRTTNPTYRDKIDFTIRELLKEYPPVKLVEIKGRLENRIQTVISNL